MWMNLDPTLMLAFEDLRKLQKEQHRSTMVIFRKKKKERLRNQQKDCRRLEREIQLFVKAARVEASCNTVRSSESTTANTVTKLQKSVVRENRALRDEIKRREIFELAVRNPNQAEIDAETLALFPVDFQSGYREYFEGGAPSFHFYPFTKAEFDTGMEHFEDELTKGSQSVAMVGNVFGWDVYRAPLETNSSSILQRVQLTKHLSCPLDVLLRESFEKEECLCPMVITPVGFSLYQRHTASTEVLQEFDQNMCVSVCSIPGPDKHLRFLYFFRQTESTLPDGRRRIEFSITAADSTLNRYSRDADTSRNVEWATEGGIHMSLTEVNETSVDAVCSRWAECKTKLHADYMMVQWTQFASLWEQTVASQRLLF
ncbi:hypothetical protein P3T76_007254 [Phytophthora citrophthora]|uniref:Uncharacterized protein n=1 Tax=Phytophthora citrophthora TaxID=4793 RepID=A0AAD9GNJ3_9STRA|nr:hypothetical protein P3T76_007254 [Phytophthora citrophthora]